MLDGESDLSCQAEEWVETGGSLLTASRVVWGGKKSDNDILDIGRSVFDWLSCSHPNLSLSKLFCTRRSLES